MTFDAPTVTSECAAVVTPTGATIAVPPSPAAKLDEACRAHGDYLYRYICSIGLSPADAEDALQDAFEAFFRAGPDSIAQPRAWLTTVARRQGFRRDPAHPVGLGHEPDNVFAQLSSRHDDIEAASVQRATAAELLRVAHAVSPEGADFLRRIADGESVADIARSQGWSHKCVYHRLELARSAIRRNALALASDTAPEPDPAVSHGTRAHARRLLDLVEALPERQQQVLTLALDGLRPRAIAVAADITGDCARANLHYAKKRIAEELGIPIADVLAQLRLIKDVTNWLATAS